VDEMSMGLAPIIVKQILQTIEEMNKSGVSILLVEQNVKVGLQVSHRAYILDKGRLTFGGSSEALLADEKLISAYLG
jgi:branched-chain amino acid transport system ATP-binding protein